MDLSTTSATAAALRVGINIIVSRRRPEIEFYYQIHNEYLPPTHTPERKIQVSKDFHFLAPARSHRSQDIYVSFHAINIGSSRAENVVFNVSGDLKRRGGRNFGNMFGYAHRQMAPGQIAFLFRLDQHELFPEDASEPPDVTLEACYQSRASVWNWPVRRWARFRGRSQYVNRFAFNGRNIATDLPPAKYNG